MSCDKAATQIPRSVLSPELLAAHHRRVALPFPTMELAEAVSSAARLLRVARYVMEIDPQELGDDWIKDVGEVIGRATDLLTVAAPVMLELRNCLVREEYLIQGIDIDACTQ